MKESRYLSDPELIQASHQWRRQAMDGNVKAASEAARHEMELRRRFSDSELDLQRAGIGADDHAEISSSEVQIGEVVRDLLRNLRKLLEMDIAVIAQLAGDRKIYRFINCSADSLVNIEEGSSISSKFALSKHFLDGFAPQIMNDVRSNPEIASLASVRNIEIGAYLIAPITLRDGTNYGAVFCVSRKPRSALGSRQLDSLRHVAEMVATRIEKLSGT